MTFRGNSYLCSLLSCVCVLSRRNRRPSSSSIWVRRSRSIIGTSSIRAKGGRGTRRETDLFSPNIRVNPVSRIGSSLAVALLVHQTEPADRILAVNSTFFFLLLLRNKLLELSYSPRDHFYLKRGGNDQPFSQSASCSSAQPTGPCWFCLASPEVEKHLVISIGTHVSYTH